MQSDIHKPSGSGKLQLNVCEARLTRNTEMFGKMDPWAKIELGKLKLRTKTIKNGGTEPCWNETFEIEVNNIS